MRQLLPVVVLLALMGACTSLTLRPVEYAWPVESVLTTDSKGFVEEERYMISFNLKPLLFEETGDSVKVGNIEIRLIRDVQGFYYMAAKEFKHVYVFATSAGALSLKNKILISEKGMEGPAFNQRSPYIQLLNGKDKPRRLSVDGILEEGKS